MVYKGLPQKAVLSPILYTRNTQYARKITKLFELKKTTNAIF